jgi:hypothetical protein
MVNKKRRLAFSKSAFAANVDVAWLVVLDAKRKIVHSFIAEKTLFKTSPVVAIIIC